MNSRIMSGMMKNVMLSVLISMCLCFSSLIPAAENHIKTSCIMPKSETEKLSSKNVDYDILKHKVELLKSEVAPALGASKAKIYIIYFFDYRCDFFEKDAENIVHLMKVRPEVRFIFKPYSTTVSNSNASHLMAVRGLQIWKSAGDEAWLTYQRVIAGLKHRSKILHVKDINAAASFAIKGLKLKGGLVNPEKILTDNALLLHALSVHIHQAFIVIPSDGANLDNITVVPGTADERFLENAIVRSELIFTSPISSHFATQKEEGKG